jgi:hypothetical protein
MWNQTRIGLTIVIIGVCAVAGCAPQSGPRDPGPRPLAAGQTCQSVRSELDSLDRKGARGIVEAHLAGRSLTPERTSMAKHYMELLGHYLGARCHVA